MVVHFILQYLGSRDRSIRNLRPLSAFSEFEASLGDCHKQKTKAKKKGGGEEKKKVLTKERPLSGLLECGVGV